MSSGDYERTFVRIFAQTDHWWAQRAAASGSATEADLPDATLAHDGLAFATEMKTSGSAYIYLDEAEVQALQRYAAAYGMISLVVGRFKGERAFYVWNPADMDRTDSGKYRGMADDGNWSVKIAHPEGSADGVEPGDLSSIALRHAVAGQLAMGMTEAPPNDEVAADV
mgnify:CR=1 FL=1